MIAGPGTFARTERVVIDSNAQCSNHWAFFVCSRRYSLRQGGLDELANTAIIALHRDSLL